MQKRFQMDKKLNLPHASSQTSESGYFSLALMDTPTSTQNGNITMHTNIPAIKEHEELHYSSSLQPTQHTAQMTTGDYNKSRSNSQTSFDHNTVYRRFYSLNDDMSSSSLALGLNCAEVQHKIVPEKLAIKMRYLLQLFIEANCIDFALVLSILLLDAASIGRIINVVIRSESLAACGRIQTSLKNVAQWSFDIECVYRSFMISLQPHIYLLDQFIQTSAASCTKPSTTGLVNNVQSGLSQSRNPDSTDHNDSSKVGEHHQVDSLNNMLQSHAHITHHNSNSGSNINNGNWTFDKYSAEDKRKILSRQLSAESANNSSTSFTQQSMLNARRSSFQHQNLDRNESSGCIVM